MRRKISDVKELADELPDLTEQQMRFVEGILGGQKITESYKAAYDCSAMQQTTIWAAASRLRHHCKISAWISAARVAGLGTATVTLSQHLNDLLSLREESRMSGNLGAAVQAEVQRGKASGLYKESLEVIVNDIGDELRLMAKDPQLAAVAEAYAKENGIIWQ